MQSLAVGRKLDSYTGVLIHAGQSSDGSAIDYFAGNSSGYVLEIDNPLGTQAMAQTILDGLKLRGTRYQPFEAGSAILDPSAELGDNVTVNGVSSILFRKLTRHSHLMAADVAAPHDEEVDHEFPFVSPLVREFKRESAYARSRLTLNANAIEAEVVRASDAEGVLSGRLTIAADAISAEVTRATDAEGTLSTRITATADAISAEVTRATDAEGTLSTRITATADAISAEVTRATDAEGTLQASISANATAITAKVSKTGGTASSFAWTLTDSSWSLSSNNQEVFKVTSGGLVVKGDITATSLTLGNGVTIGASKVSGLASVATSGSYADLISKPDLTVYVAKDGTIGTEPASGVTGFKVSSAGLLTCSNAVIYGTIYATAGNLGGWAIAATGISKTVSNSFRIRLLAPASPTSSSTAFIVQDWHNSAWRNMFSISYGGEFYARNAFITGSITATSGTIGGVTISDGVLTGIKSTNIALNTITGGSSGNIALNAITTNNTSAGVNTSLGYADFANGVFSGLNTANYMNASAVYATTLIVNGEQFVKGTISFIDGNGNLRSFSVLKEAGT